jgi:hypothetical protein
MPVARANCLLLRVLGATPSCLCGEFSRTIAYIAIAALIAGCGARPALPTQSARQMESSLPEQVAAVRDGRSDAVRLDHTLVRDEDLLPLAGLGDRLRRINFSHSEISDSGLATIGRLPALEQLRLSSARVTDAGLAHVAGLAHLRFLHLLDMPITDTGLDRLRGLKKLESLYLDRTNVTDEGLARLIKALPGVHLHIDDHHHPLDPHGKEHGH